jgi:hypothetical protein
VPKEGQNKPCVDISKNETDFLVPFIIHSQLIPALCFQKPDIYSGSARLNQPAKALKHSKSLPVRAGQKLFFEPVKDRWGIRELF